MKRTWLSVAVILLLIGLSVPPVGAGHNVYLQAGTTYYVSSSGGDDDNDGLSTGTPFETIDKVNSLDLEPGDSVLFKCGDTWRAEMLTIARSGTAGNPITFGMKNSCVPRCTGSSMGICQQVSIRAGATPEALIDFQRSVVG